jgi:sugar phosphate isomerase/epimerase
MMIGERSAIVTLGEALDLALRFDADQVGVVVDAYHVWWDPALERELARAAGRVVGFHVSDWLVPTPDLLQGRGMLGDGIIDLRGLRHLVEATGYDGPIEVEVINRDLWRLPGDALVTLVRERFAAVV